MKWISFGYTISHDFRSILLNWIVDLTRKTRKSLHNRFRFSHFDLIINDVLDFHTHHDQTSILYVRLHIWNIKSSILCICICMCLWRIKWFFFHSLKNHFRIIGYCIFAFASPRRDWIFYKSKATKKNIVNGHT